VIINRHNYEPILLDCLEGRLNASERAEVETFLQENPDILAEFHALKAGFDLPDISVISPDFSFLKQPIGPTDVLDADIVEALARPDDHSLPAIDIARLKAMHPNLAVDIELLRLTKLIPNHSQNVERPAKIWAEDVTPFDALLVMAAEGDLSAGALQVLEEFGPSDTQNRLSVLSATKLKPQTHITFPNKAGLYQTPVVALWYNHVITLAAAAVLLLFAAWFVFQNPEVGTAFEATTAALNEAEPPAKMPKNVVSNEPVNTQEKKQSPVRNSDLAWTKPAVPATIPVQKAGAVHFTPSQNLMLPGIVDMAFTPWEETEFPEQKQPQASKKSLEELAVKGIDELFALNRSDDQNITSALFSKATNKLNENENVRVQLPGPNPERQMAGWKVRLGQLQVAKNN